jgi:hypothetical protein
MRQREFIKLVGAGSAATLPLGARTQQAEQTRRIGVPMNWGAYDPEGQADIVAFRESLQRLGWNEGGNVRIDIRWGEDDVERERQYAAELVRAQAGYCLSERHLKRSTVATHHAQPADCIRRYARRQNQVPSTFRRIPTANELAVPIQELEKWTLAATRSARVRWISAVWILPLPYQKCAAK